MSGALALLKVIPGWLWLVLSAAGLIWWQEGRVDDARQAQRGAEDSAQACTVARQNLVTLANEQGKALGDLVQAGKDREAQAQWAVKSAKADARVDYAAANRLQQERTGGDQCVAAGAIIDKELGL